MWDIRAGTGPAVIPLFGLTERDTAKRAIVLELPQPTIHAAPVFVADLPDRDFPPCGMWGRPRDNHGTSLLQTDDALLTGANLIITRDGEWHCESILHRDHIVAFYGSDTFHAVYPGRKPRITRIGNDALAGLSHLDPGDFVHIDEPVLLATPGEPDNWGRWVVQVLPKLMYFAETATDCRLLCRMDRPWQWAMAKYLGIPPEAIIAHDPGRAYSCDRVTMLQHSSADGTVSAREHAMFQRLADAACHREYAPSRPRIFVSRQSEARRNPDYRPLLNEPDLIAALEALDFITIEPETLSFGDQIRAFANASVVVGLGGAGMFNVAFCRSGTRTVTIEASDHFILSHSGIFSSLGLSYGVIYGKQDLTAGSPDNPHLPWTLDIPRAIRAISDFL